MRTHYGDVEIQSGVPGAMEAHTGDQEDRQDLPCEVSPWRHGVLVPVLFLCTLKKAKSVFNLEMLPSSESLVELNQKTLL